MKRVAGYTKLAKLWYKDHDEAIALQERLYEEKFSDDGEFRLAGVYVDITGNKETWKRPQMMRLLNAIDDDDIDIIYTQTKGYLAANTRELCYLLRLIFGREKRIDIITEDLEYNINTYENTDRQREELDAMSKKYSMLNPEDFEAWKKKVSEAMEKERS